MNKEKCCGNCKWFKEVDATVVMNDPGAKFTACTWRPKQPFWISPPYLSGHIMSGLLNASRNPEEGSECEVYEE